MIIKAECGQVTEQTLSAWVLCCASLMEINDYINNECERLNHTKMTVLGVPARIRPVGFTSLCVSHLFTLSGFSCILNWEI